MTTPTERKGDPAKLVSLLALAAGAAAMPQTSNADIIFQPANAHMGFGAGDTNSFPLSLSGTTQFRFGTSHSTVPRSSAGQFKTQYRSVLVGWAGGGKASVQTVGGLAAAREKGEPWNNGLHSVTYATAAKATIHRTFSGSIIGAAHHPDSDYDHKYLAFKFQDGGWLYGWVEVGLTVGPEPSMTIYGYAYDDSGAQIVMGAMPVPEPAPMAMLALGALALGAKGVRAWRRSQTKTR